MAITVTPFSSVLVAGAGTANADGFYTPQGVENAFPYFNLIGTLEDDVSNAITADGIRWIMYDAVGDGVYVLDDIPAYPWEGSWEVGDVGAPPPPTVTQAPVT